MTRPLNYANLLEILAAHYAPPDDMTDPLCWCMAEIERLRTENAALAFDLKDARRTVEVQKEIVIGAEELTAQALADNERLTAENAELMDRTMHKDGLTCTWTEEENHDYWETSCGDQFVIIEGTPGENDMIYCHHCGRRLVVAETPARDDADE